MANNVKVFVDYGPQGSAPLAAPRFNLLIQEVDPADPTKVVAEERFIRLDVDAAASSSVKRVLEQQSNLVRVSDPCHPSESRPAESAPTARSPACSRPAGRDMAHQRPRWRCRHCGAGHRARSCGNEAGYLCPGPRRSLQPALHPPYDRDHEVANADWAEAAAYCLQHRAVLLVDGPSAWNDPAHVITGLQALKMTASMNAAVYFPWIRVADPMKQNLLVDFPPSGAIAGVIARTDANRGIWKSPAGLEASVAAQGLTVRLNDSENGRLNPLGVNCLRSFPTRVRRLGARAPWTERMSWPRSGSISRSGASLSTSRRASIVAHSGSSSSRMTRDFGHRSVSILARSYDLFRQGAFRGCVRESLS